MNQESLSEVLIDINGCIDAGLKGWLNVLLLKESATREAR